MHKSKSLRKTDGAASISEFAAALSLLVVFVITLLDVAAAASVSTILWMFTRNLSVQVANSSSYEEAVEIVNGAYEQLALSPLFRLIIPRASGERSGRIDLILEASDLKTGQVRVIDPRLTQSKRRDLSQYGYTYRVETKFKLAPLVNLSGITLGKGIAGLSEDTTLCFSCARNVEHPLRLFNN